MRDRITLASTQISVDTIEKTRQSKTLSSKVEIRWQKIGHTRFLYQLAINKTDQLNLMTNWRVSIDSTTIRV